MKKWFYRFGTVFFITATLYFTMLLFKAYIWQKWLNTLQQQLYKQTPPTQNPLGDDYRIFKLTKKGHLCDRKDGLDSV